MKNKILIYALIGIGILLLIGSFMLGFKTTGDNIKTNPELDKYRSEDIPEQCRLPDGQDDLAWWKQHLSHHKETWYCLDYYP